jgi:hypothetical protein
VFVEFAPSRGEKGRAVRHLGVGTLLGPAGIADQRAAETLGLHLLEIARDGVARDVAVEPPPVGADPGGRRRIGPEIVERISAGNRGAEDEAGEESDSENAGRKCSQSWP